MTKKKVNTTYRREFSPERSAAQKAAVRSFSANFNYRGYRRQIEHSHHRSPFIWDDWEYGVDDLNEQDFSGDEIGRKKLKKKPKVIVRSSSSDSDISSEDVPAKRGHGQRFVTSRHDTSLSDSDCNCGADLRQTEKAQSPPARFLSDTISKSLKKVSKRSGQVEVDGSRPRSAPIDDSPFVQYGAGDSEEETGNKRTHNVLSRQGVYPAALGAKTRHAAMKGLRSRARAREVKSKTTLQDSEFDMKMNKQTSNWRSEYNEGYGKYPTCYNK